MRLSLKKTEPGLHYCAQGEEGLSGRLQCDTKGDTGVPFSSPRVRNFSTKKVGFQKERNE